MTPSPARVRVSGAQAVLEHAAVETEADVAAHRAVNIIIALLALFVALPLLLLIAVAVKLSSRGPVLYTQERVGLDRRAPGAEAGNRRRSRDLGGRPFTIYKFRTMRGSSWVAQTAPVPLSASTRIVRNL